MGGWGGGDRFIKSVPNTIQNKKTSNLCYRQNAESAGERAVYTCRITAVTSVTKPTVNQNSVNIYLRRVLQFGKQFPRNRDSKYTDKAERKINKQVTQPFSIHSTAAAELTVRGRNQKAVLSPYGAFHYGNYSKNNYSNKIQQKNESEIHQ
jgi:hypothetical protein